MADETNELETPIIPEPTEPGVTGIEKFKSGGDRDKAYLELEKQNGEQSRRLAEVEAKIDAYASASANAAPAPQHFADQYPSTKTVDEREAELASRLLTRPTEVLRQVREETMREVQAHLANERIVIKFQREHPDLAKHEEIVAMFVRKQPESFSADQRLKLAVPEARRYLASLSGSNSNQQAALDPAAYVESPTQRPATPASAVAEPSEEDELTALIRERSTLQAKKMQA